MGPLGWFVLLAFVLLGATTEHDVGEVSDHQGYQGCGGECFCEVTSVQGNSATIRCEGKQADIRKSNGQEGKNKTVKHEETDSESAVSKTISIGNSGKRKTGENVSSKDGSSRTSVENNTYRKTTEQHKSSIYSSYLTNKNISKNEHNQKSKGSQECWKRYTSSFTNITTIKANFIKSTSFLNVSSFPNARTVILKVNNYVNFKICGTSQVSSVEATSTGLRSGQFVKDFLNLTSLNLSDNAIQHFPFKILPISLTSIDISRNNMTFNTNISLPHNIQFMNISDNHIKSIDGMSFDGNLTVLDVSENGLEIFPHLNLQRLEELYISRNKITSLVNGCFSKVPFLVTVDLHSNRIKTIEETTFEGLTKLQRLDLAENNIVSLGPTTFQFLTNLVTLNISKNTHLGNPQDIEEPYFLFGTSQRLQTIEASNINMTKIPSTISRSVRKLFLSNNMIDIIQCGQLDSFPLLQVLDLSNNLIKDVEEDALGRLDFLSHFILHSNQIKSVPKSLPDQLQVLDLRHNEIQNLTRFDFLGLQKLKVLLLSKNKIQTIEDGTFGQLVLLDVLDLSFNPILILSRTSLVGPRSLKEIHLNSLKDLIPLQDPLSFPAPESAHLEVLNVESSPVLASQLMDDVAALTMFHELFHLNLNHCRLLNIRDDLPKYLPRLHKLELNGNNLNCTNIIWLVKWLQALNISMQDTGKFRQEIYNLRDICEEDNVEEDTSVKCASPEDLVGREIISLKDEDFPDLKLTSSSLPPTRQVLINKSYLQQTSVDNTSNLIDSSKQTSPTLNYSSFSLDSLTVSSTSFSSSSDLISKTLFITPKQSYGKTGVLSNLYTPVRSGNYSNPDHSQKSNSSLTNTSSSLFDANSPSSILYSETVDSLQLITSTSKTLPNISSTFHTSITRKYKSNPSEINTLPIFSTTLEKPPLKRINSIRKEAQKYQESVRVEHSDPDVVLLNDSSATNDFDNHVNDTASLGAFSASKTATSHPGMLLFLSVVGVILLASGVMGYSHFRQRRRGREYQQHQDIEVNSLGGYDLW